MALYGMVIQNQYPRFWGRKQLTLREMHKKELNALLKKYYAWPLGKSTILHMGYINKL